MGFKEWIIKGVSASDGGMDDARIHAGMLVLTYIGAAIALIYHTPPQTLADSGQFIQSFGIGAAAMAGGIGAWFGLRKDN